MAEPNWAALEARINRLAANARTPEQRQYITGARDMLQQERSRLATASPQEKAFIYGLIEARLAQWESAGQRAASPAPTPSVMAPMMPTAPSSSPQPSPASGNGGGVPTWAKVLGGLALFGGIYYVVKD